MKDFIFKVSDNDNAECKIYLLCSTIVDNQKSFFQVLGIHWYYQKKIWNDNSI